MRHIDLTAKIGNVLALREPFWIASSHLTSTQSAIDAWAKIHPAALTLKSCTINPKVEQKETVRELLYPGLPRFGRSVYCDGPKHKEFLTYKQAGKFLQYAKKKLPDCAIGTSVLAGKNEKYDEFKIECSDSSFFELNLKYAFRIPPGEALAEYRALVRKNFDDIITEVRQFCGTFNGSPIFIKIPRELDWLPRTEELETLLSTLKDHGTAGLILTNSEKRDLPAFVKEGREKLLQGGVICGEHLFDGTIELINKLRDTCQSYGVPIVSSGGMITEGQILQAIQAGAFAVQLCTTFDYNGLTFYKTLRSALHARIYLQALDSFSDFRNKLPTISTALIYNTPFTYYERFYSEEAQRQICDDVRTSDRMDVMLLSGQTLLERWKKDLDKRFRKNLGLRLFIANTECDIYKALQKSWGIREGSELEARQSRARETVKQLSKLWKAAAKDRQKAASENPPEAEFVVYEHDQCPFYSCYVFDSKVYVCPYPFVWTKDLLSPTYVFFGSSEEYNRISAELDRVRAKVSQTQRK